MAASFCWWHLAMVLIVAIISSRIPEGEQSKKDSVGVGGEGGKGISATTFECHADNWLSLCKKDCKVMPKFATICSFNTTTEEKASSKTKTEHKSEKVEKKKKKKKSKRSDDDDMDSQFPWGPDKHPWGDTKFPWGDSKYPWGDSEFPWGDSEYPWGNTKNPWGNGTYPWGDSKYPWGNKKVPKDHRLLLYVRDGQFLESGKESSSAKESDKSTKDGTCYCTKIRDS